MGVGGVNKGSRGPNYMAAPVSCMLRGNGSYCYTVPS